MKHLKSKKTGNIAETNLLKMIKNDKKKHQYVSCKLSEFGATIKQIAKNNDMKLTKYLLRLTYEEFRKNIISSRLNEGERTHLDNALHTRYLKKIRQLEIPLN